MSDKVRPSRKCPECRGYIQGDGVIHKKSRFNVEYCSTDCLLDAYERKCHRAGPYRESRAKVRTKLKPENE